MGPRDDIPPDEALAAAQDAVRGAVAADPALLEDEGRYRRAAADAAREASAGDEAARDAIERALLAMRGQLVEGGS